MAPVNNFLFERDGRIVLIDAGAGNTMQPTLGRAAPVAPARMFDGARMPPRPLAQFAEPDRWMVRFGLPPANLWLSARMVGRPLTQVAAHGRVVVLGPEQAIEA